MSVILPGTDSTGYLIAQMFLGGHIKVLGLCGRLYITFLMYVSRISHENIQFHDLFYEITERNNFRVIK